MAGDGAGLQRENAHVLGGQPLPAISGQLLPLLSAHRTRTSPG
jgi:hypothetical protein